MNPIPIRAWHHFNEKAPLAGRFSFAGTIAAVM